MEDGSSSSQTVTTSGTYSHTDDNYKQICVDLPFYLNYGPAIPEPTDVDELWFHVTNEYKDLCRNQKEKDRIESKGTG